MLSSTLWRALTTPVTYALLVVLVGTAIMQVRYVNKALQRFDSTQVIPVQFVMFTLSVILGSAILYKDFEKATAEMIVKFIGGCLLTFFGVYLITSGRPSRDDDSDGESDEGEERIGLADQEFAEVDDQAQDGTTEFDTARRRAGLSQGDGVEDESRSRRASKVSFADNIRPQTPHRHSNHSYQPSIRLSTPVDEELAGIEDTPLLGNPWKSTSEELLQAARHPGIIQSSSHPILPSEAQTSSESLRPPGTPRTSSQGNVHTHPNHQQSPAPPQADRPVTPARHSSISRMMPGPLLSPLSGGLSAVVADSLRRGVDFPSRSKGFKRPRLNLRRSKSGSQRLSHASGDEDDFDTSPLRQVESLTQAPEADVSKSLGNDGSKDWGRLTRARSLSTTLSDMFRGKKQKRDEEEEEGQPGPSGL